MAKLGEAPTAVSGALDTLLQVQKSSDTVLSKSHIMLLGSSGHGKTVAASSASTVRPAELPASGIELDDLFWLLFDVGGLDGFNSLGLSVPYLDFTNLTTGVTSGVMRAITQVVGPRVREGKTKTLVVDSVTMMNESIDNSHSKMEGWDRYRAVKTDHQRIFQAIKALPCNVVFICHGKVTAETLNAEQQAAGLTPGAIDLDITGAAKSFYRASMSMIIPVVRRGRGDKSEDFRLYPYGTKGYFWKCRFPGLEREEPANLSQLFEKVKKGANNVAR